MAQFDLHHRPVDLQDQGGHERRLARWQLREDVANFHRDAFLRSQHHAFGKRAEVPLEKVVLALVHVRGERLIETDVNVGRRVVVGGDVLRVVREEDEAAEVVVLAGLFADEAVPTLAGGRVEDEHAKFQRENDVGLAGLGEVEPFGWHVDRFARCFVEHVDGFRVDQIGDEGIGDSLRREP